MSVQEVWDCYNLGEAMNAGDGHQTGMKPPLRLVEQYFQSRWRKSSLVRYSLPSTNLSHPTRLFNFRLAKTGSAFVKFLSG